MVTTRRDTLKGLAAAAAVALLPAHEHEWTDMPLVNLTPSWNEEIGWGRFCKPCGAWEQTHTHEWAFAGRWVSPIDKDPYLFQWEVHRDGKKYLKRAGMTCRSCGAHGRHGSYQGLMASLKASYAADPRDTYWIPLVPA
jgi:hypothetical protein